MNEQINLNEIGADGLPMYDENGEKYDDVKQKTPRKPKMYPEGWLEHYKQTGYYKDYTKRNMAIPLKCKFCGTMSFKIGIHQHQKKIKCMELRKINNNELLVASVL